MTRTPTARALVAAAATCTAALALTGCAPAPDAPSSSSSSTPGDSTPRADAATSTPTQHAAAPVAVDSPAITDDIFGHSIRPTEVVRHYPIDTDKQSGWAKKDDVEQVLVKVDVTAGTKYYSSIACYDLAVLPADDDNARSQDATDVIGEEMTAAGYPPLEQVKTGESGSGWCAFLVTNPANKPLELVWKRIPTNTPDGQQHPAEQFRTPLID